MLFRSLVDLKISYDVEAIYNSLFGLFNTAPGERLLLPEYGIDIRRYLFRPISPNMAQVIGETLKEGVGTWEPRVILEQVSVQPYPDTHTYIIALEMYIPSLKRSTTLAGSFIRGKGFTRG